MNDKRVSERTDCEAHVIIENCETGEYYDGSLYNYSQKGMYVELDYPLKIGSEIRIVIRKTKDSTHLESCQAKVIWCEEIPGAVVLYNYGIGVLNDPTGKFSNAVKKFQVINGGASKDNS